MRNFIHSLFSNRLGNILAIINFSLLAISQSAVVPMWPFLRRLPKILFLVNLPARMAPGSIFWLIMPEVVIPRPVTGDGFDVLVLMYLQWVFIGWLAHQIAGAIQPTELVWKV
jgi:hypothetical protein